MSLEVMREQRHSDVSMVNHSEGTPDSRRYNKPTVSEVAVIMPVLGYGEDAASRDCVASGFSRS